jgi:ATP-dependent helicase/DNAse subunit B
MKNLKDNTLLIIPNHLKETILLSFCDELKNIKIMTESEFLKKYYFDYDLETIYYLMNKYKLKYEVVLIYLKNLYYVENKEYSNEKLNKLVEIKKELEEHNLLKYKPLFLNKLKSMNIVFYNFYDLDKFYLNLIDNLKKITSVEVINEENNCYYEHKIYEFKNAEEEVEFVATKICELVLSGVNINNIVLLNSSDIYTNHIKRIFKYFSIPINIKDNNSLLGTKMGTFFLENINSDISKTFELLEINFDLKNSLNLEIYNRLITISNKFSFVSDYMEIKKLLKVELLNTKLSDVILDEAVKVEVLEDYIPNDNEYVFLLGFNQGECPKNLKDEDYINDLLKEKLNLSTTTIKNIIHNKKIISIIKNAKNLWITYKLNGEQGSLTVSSLNEKLNYEVIHNIKISYNYSNLNNNLKLARYMDDYLKYGSKNEDLDLLNNTYKNNVYRKYDNKFNGIKKTSENITLSYSSMDNYYKCSFKYYISSILKLNCYEETFMTYIGSLFHYVLSKKDNLSLEDSITEFMNNNPKEFTNKENFFLEKLKKDLEFILDVIKKQKDYTNFHNALYEKYIEIPKGNDKFIGIVDKILLNDNKTLGAIVDYKTGNPSLELNYIEYGLGLQLPIYLYLINKINPDIEVVGFYLQKILPSLITRNPLKDITSQKRDLLKLQGFSLSEEEKLSEFDKTYIDSELIKSMKVGNNGFYAYSKTLTKNNMENIVKIIDQKIDEALTNIHNNNFDINPKVINNKNIGCEYCKFKDICYMTEKDIVRLKDIDNLDFLGGDNNA